MHELKIAEDLVTIVLDTARGKHLSKVSRVNITFGQLVQIVPEIFEFAFREIVRNSIAEAAELNIEIVQVKMKCKNCGNDFQVKENRFACNICNSTDLEIIQGKELFIKSIEGVQ
jgi:hydrogenase nickel incorporation protein HypA/HybF